VSEPGGLGNITNKSYETKNDRVRFAGDSLVWPHG